MIIVCLEFELGKQSGVFRLCGSLNDSDHVYHLQETTALLYPKSFHIGIQVPERIKGSGLECDIS